MNHGNAEKTEMRGIVAAQLATQYTVLGPHSRSIEFQSQSLEFCEEIIASVCCFERRKLLVAKIRRKISDTFL